MRAKVLHVITHLGVGGAQDNTLITVRELRRSRYEVHLATGQDETDWLGRARDWSDLVHSIKNLRRPINVGRDLKALIELIKLMRRNKYHIVHTHSSKAGVLGRIAARLAGVPIIVHTWHGPSWTPSMPGPVRLCCQLLERCLSLLTDAVITVCELNRRELIGLRIARPNKITTIHSGIDLSNLEKQVDRVLKCREVGLDPGRPIVGCVARLSDAKAPLDFIAAAKLASRAMPEIQFVLVGDGPLRHQVQASIEDSRNILLLGARSDVPELLQVLDVFALASMWEGLGRALTEALMSGRPVAVTEVGGIPEIVEHEKTGLLSPPKRPDLLASNIIRLVSDPEFANALGRSGRERVIASFTSDSMATAIDGLYQLLLRRCSYFSSEDLAVPAFDGLHARAETTTTPQS